MGSVDVIHDHWREQPMNKGGLVAEVAKRTGLGKAEVGRVIDAMIETVRDAVVHGERVTLADFGTFERKHRNVRIARNPRKPNVPIVVPARDLPSFTPGKDFRARVLNTDGDEEMREDAAAS
jgi:DNA-binding protein HU-beta